MLLTKQLLVFRPNKMDWIFAIKTFLAGMLSLYVAFSLDLAYPIWAIGTVFVIANPYSGMTSSKSIYRIFGTLLGVVVSVVVTPLLINTPLIFTLFLAFWVGFCLYISLLDRTPRSYVCMLAGYTTVIICFNIIYSIDNSSVFDMAVGRFLEITVGVVCSAIVATTIFPMHIGPAVKVRVTKALQDTKILFEKILIDEKELENYSAVLSNIARDIADIHVMAVHLSYEKSTLKGMTKPLQEMLHQLSMLVTNLVAMAERIKQLDQIDLKYREKLKVANKHIIQFLEQDVDISEAQINALPNSFEQDFSEMSAIATSKQQIILLSLKMDVRHFIQNVRAIKLIWKRIQRGNAVLPESVAPLTTSYPSLHRDHGVALRGGVSAFLIVIIATTFWIVSGWKAGFMLAEMAAISACILTFMDNPVPALKVFIRGNIYAGILVFIYAYGIFPSITEFWQLCLALAPFIIYCLMMFPHPPLMGLALPVLMGTIMGLNLHNHYTLDQISFFDASIATVIGPIISVYVIHLVRAMSPDITAKRILALHYKAIRQALYIPYGVSFRIHLRGMLDRIGILNTKVVQSDALKQDINFALIESSAVIDLTRIQELMNKMDTRLEIFQSLTRLQSDLDDYFLFKELHQTENKFRNNLLKTIQNIKQQATELEDVDISQRIKISLNNIQSSLCHASFDETTQAHLVGA